MLFVTSIINPVKRQKFRLFPIKGLSVLDICCGSGMVSEYYAREGAEVTETDISPECVERTEIQILIKILGGG